MNRTIEARELIILDGPDSIVRGTYHMASDGRSSSQSWSIQSRSLGILFLNSLSPTRAAHGDSAVYWADSFAKCGYPSFRLDLPGFGDSEGEPPPELLKFINEGGYAQIAAAKAAQLVERFNLSGVVIVGLCAGAVSAIHTAASSKECRGLVLMDPYFHLPLAPRSKVWEKLTGRLLRSALGRTINNLYERLCDRLRGIRVLLLGNVPPSNANFSLIARWKELASTGLPILVFKAPGTKLRGGEFDYLKYVLGVAGQKSRVVVKVIEGSGHTFSNRVGRAAVRQHVESWLNAFFQRMTRKDDGVNLSQHEEIPTYTLRAQLDESESHDKLHHGCLHG